MTRRQATEACIFLVHISLVIASISSPTSAKRYPHRNADTYYDQRSGAHNRPHSSSSSHSYSSFYGFSGLLPTVQCYSCMSDTYDTFWDEMQKVYKKQHMTNRCNEPFFSRGIPYVNCSNICVTMKETIHVAGVRAVTAYIRGCLDKILVDNHRFNETALITYNFYRKDHCRELPRSLLISPGIFGNVLFCTCYGNRCNNAAEMTPAIQFLIQRLWIYSFGSINFHWTKSISFFLADYHVHSWLIVITTSLFHFAVVALGGRILFM